MDSDLLRDAAIALNNLARLLRAGAPNPSTLEDFARRAHDQLRLVLPSIIHDANIDIAKAALCNIESLTIDGRVAIIREAVTQFQQDESQLPADATWRDLAQLPALNRAHFDHVAASFAELANVLNDDANSIENWAQIAVGASDVGDDTKGDTPKKKPKQPRKLNIHAIDCARRYKEARKTDATITMKQVVSDYYEETGKSSVESIIRVLNDHPDQWKDDKNTT